MAAESCNAYQLQLEVVEFVDLFEIGSLLSRESDAQVVHQSPQGIFVFYRLAQVALFAVGFVALVFF